MKICFLAHAGSIHTERWVSYFVNQGHSVSLVSFTPAAFDFAGVDLHLLTSRLPISRERSNLHYMLRAPKLRGLLAALQPDLINAHFLSSYGFLGALARPAKCPLVTTLHGSDILLFPKRSPLHAHVTRYALGRADMIISVAQHITELLPRYLLAEIPVLTIQYGLDLQRFRLPDSDASRQPICLSNRAMVPISNLETLIAAAKVLEERGSPLVIEMAGHGDQLAQLRASVEKMNLRNRVRFSGTVDHLEMARLLQTAAIFVSVSLSDGTSLSLLEAMACGAFPVVSDIAANREWIEDGINGYLVAPDSSDELARRLADAWAAEDLRRSASERNWRLIQQRADYQRNMAIIERRFVDLVNAFRTGI